MKKSKSSICFVFLLIVLTFISNAKADLLLCNADRRDFYRGWRSDWPSKCGKRPDTEYLSGLKRDCAATKARIEFDIKTSGVGSWPANWSGVYGEETCLALDFGGEL